LGAPVLKSSVVNRGSLIDRLQGLLQQQLELVHRGNLASAVELFDQTDRCVQEIVGAGGENPARSGSPAGSQPSTADSARQWQGVEQLYRELSLVLTAQRTEVTAALEALQQSKKVLNTYLRTTFQRR